MVLQEKIIIKIRHDLVRKNPILVYFSDGTTFQFPEHFQSNFLTASNDTYAYMVKCPLHIHNCFCKICISIRLYITWSSTIFYLTSYCLFTREDIFKSGS